MKLMLLSNSANHGSGFLEHALPTLTSVLGHAPGEAITTESPGRGRRAAVRVLRACVDG